LGRVEGGCEKRKGLSGIVRGNARLRGREVVYIVGRGVDDEVEVEEEREQRRCVIEKEKMGRKLHELGLGEEWNEEGRNSNETKKRVVKVGGVCLCPYLECGN